jgi:hypothetical protein
VNDTPPPDRKWTKARTVAAITTGAIVLAYGAIFRWLFTWDLMEAAGGVVSLAFIFSVPVSCGVISVAVGRMFGSEKWWLYSMVVPGFAIMAGLVISIILRIEAVICVAMAAPIVFGGSVLGGLLGHVLLPRDSSRQHLRVTFAVFLPFIAAWVEGSMHWPSETKAISNTIVIEAPAERIWPEIASVETIKPDRIRNRWIYWIGFPKPIAATLDHPRAGGVRIATFERDVSFFEEVTVWDPPHTLSFSIHADPEFIPQSAFDRHILVGGRFYDVLDGTYRIESLGPNRCRLHLTSNHRLTTRFNAYAAWWSVQIMDQIQGSILEVIRERAEKPITDD